MQMGCGREVQARLQEVQLKLKAQYPVNHYAVLGVKSSASPAEIKTAYRYEFDEARLSLLGVTCA